MRQHVEMRRDQYVSAFRRECSSEYSRVDDLEHRAGFALQRGKLESAARVLACPVKVSPPNWQHGRVIYATLRERLALSPVPEGSALCLDIGTAKGFSALCARWALADSGYPGRVVSVDVIDPRARIARNTVAEVDGLLTLAETLSDWPESADIEFVQASGVNWLTMNRQRVHFAFVDGKHNYAAVSEECRLLSQSQSAGDAIVFDDVQIPGVRRAVEELSDSYDAEYVEALPTRVYVITRRTR